MALRDVQGALVKDWIVPPGSSEILIDETVRPGIYHLQASGEGGTSRYRLMLP